MASTNRYVCSVCGVVDDDHRFNPCEGGKWIQDPQLVSLDCPNCGSEDYVIRQHTPSISNGGFDGQSTHCLDCDYEDVG